MIKRLNRKGFTLIELLIVIAVLGILAAVAFVIINPAETLARARDGGRKTAVAQVGNGVQLYYTANNSTYPTTSTWDAVLTGSSFVKTFPTVTQPITAPTATACTVNLKTGLCYSLSATDAVVYTTLESGVEKAKCVAATPVPYYVWSSFDGRAGVVCKATGVAAEPAAGAQTFAAN